MDKEEYKVRLETIRSLDENRGQLVRKMKESSHLDGIEKIVSLIEQYTR